MLHRMDMSGVKLRSNTSTMVGERLYYIVKKNYDGTTANLYVAYDYESGIKTAFHHDKTLLIEWLNDNASRIEEKLKRVENESL